MTESMIERVAKAIEESMFAPHELPCEPELHARYIDTARAAIEAMREPTETMIDASPEEGTSYNEYSRGYAADYYRAMIDAALKWPAGSADRADVPMASD